MTWQDDFAPDGSLRDVVVTGATPEDWQVVLELIESRYQPLRFVDGEQTSDRIYHERLFVAGDARLVLLFHVGETEVACHFFDEHEIEFDFCPDRIRTEAELAPILRFVEEIGSATGKAAAITPENLHDSAIFQFSPGSGVVHYLAL